MDAKLHLRRRLAKRWLVLGQSVPDKQPAQRENDRPDLQARLN